MKDKKELIGKVCYGLDKEGNMQGIGWYLGMNEYTQCYSITTSHNRIGSNPKDNGMDYYGIKEIETQTISPILEHYGKKAYVWDDNRDNAYLRTLIHTYNKGSCMALDDIATLEDFEDKGYSNHWDHFELVNEININISIGSETNLTIDKAIDKLKALKEV